VGFCFLPLPKAGAIAIAARKTQTTTNSLFLMISVYQNGGGFATSNREYQERSFYGRTREEAVSRAEALALCVLASGSSMAKCRRWSRRLSQLQPQETLDARPRFAEDWPRCCASAGQLNANPTDRTRTARAPERDKGFRTISDSGTT
jgi:hypothetical protein